MPLLERHITKPCAAAEEAALPGRQSNGFLLLYALAYAGCFVSFVPLLTLLLPEKMASAAGDARIEWLSTATLAGAVSASLANIGFGWASDLVGSRRAWLAAGLLSSLASYALLHLSQSPLAIVLAVIVYQAAINMMLSPLTAWAADTVPDAQKGRLGGLLGLAPPVGALAGIVVTLPILPGAAAQMLMVCLLFALLILPLLAVGHPAPIHLGPRLITGVQRTQRRIDLFLLWVARLLVQIAGSVLFAFLLYYFQSLPDTSASQSDVARLSAFTMVASVPLALLAGWASDRLGVRMPFLIGTAIAACSGLTVLALQPGLGAATAGYAIFGCATSVFFAIHSVYAMQMLPSPLRRGRDLGLFNLTNTLPAILSPLLALTVVPRIGFPGLMATLAVLTLVAALLLVLVRTEDSAREGHLASAEAS
jgi:MFS family permease